MRTAGTLYRTIARLVAAATRETELLARLLHVAAGAGPLDSQPHLRGT